MKKNVLLLLSILFVLRFSVVAQTMISFTPKEVIVTFSMSKFTVKNILLSRTNDIVLSGVKTFNDYTKDNSSIVYFRSSENGKWYQSELKQKKGVFFSGTFGAIDSNDQLHFVYGNRTFDIKNTVPLFNQLQYTKNEKNNWTKPETIFELNTNNIDFGMSAVKIYLDKKNDPFLFFVSKVDSLSNPKLNYLKHNKAGWSKLLSIDDYPADFDVGIDENGTYHVSFLKGMTGKGTDRNSIFYCHSIDSSDAFSLPVLVHRSGMMSTDEIKIIVDSNTVRHIIFSKNLDKNMFSDAIYHCYSKDGITWTDSVKINKGFEGNNLNSTVVIDSKNNLHLFWEWSPNLFNKPSSILYSKYDGAKWSDPIIIFEKATTPVVTIDKKDFIRIVYKDLSQRENKKYSLIYSKTDKPVTSYTN